MWSFIGGALLGYFVAILPSVIENFQGLYQLKHTFDDYTSSTASALFETARTAAEIWFVYLEQFLNQTCVQVGPRLWLISHVINGKEYRFYIRPHYGPPKGKGSRAERALELGQQCLVREPLPVK